MNKETMTETHRNKWPQSVSIGKDDNQLAITKNLSACGAATNILGVLDI